MGLALQWVLLTTQPWHAALPHLGSQTTPAQLGAGPLLLCLGSGGTGSPTLSPPVQMTGVLYGCSMGMERHGDTRWWPG